MPEAPEPLALELHDLDDTRRLASSVAAALPAGSLLVLSGPLGAGKTTFTGLVAAALGSTAAVTSPTYTLVHEYPTPTGPLVHIDAYRLEGATDLSALGLDDYLERSRLLVVEWGEVLLDAYPEAFWLELGFPAKGSSGDPGVDELSSGRVARWRRRHALNGSPGPAADGTS